MVRSEPARPLPGAGALATSRGAMVSRALVLSRALVFRVMPLVLLMVLVFVVSPGPPRARALIEPRLDRPRWWVPPSNPTDGRSFPAQPKVSRHASRDQKDDPLALDPPDALPAYIVSEHTVGPKPPPGYSFSAGPKPARYPKSPPPSPPPSPPQDDPEVRETATPAPPPPTTPEVTVVDNTLNQLWPKSTRNFGGARPRSGGSSRPSDTTVCGPLCPTFRLASRSARYDIRLYPRTLWVSYVTVTENRLLAEMEAHAGLTEFLGGRNSHGVELPQTYPYVTQLRYGRVPGLHKQESDFSVSVPLLEDSFLPRPDSNQLVVDYVSKQRVFVTSFWARPWKLTDKSLRTRAKRFIRRLRRHGHSFLDTYYYLAKYDSAESRKRSFYEIWLYSTPYKSKRRFRPTGKPQMPRPSNRTVETMQRLCRGLECPKFEVLSEYRGGVQKRHYYNAVFATAPMEGCDSSIDAMWRGLLPLHLYRHGINSHLEVIEATRPIGVLRVTEQEPGGANGTCAMTSLMYLPRRLHQNPPNAGPSAPPTSLAYVHDMHVFVQTVGGFVLEPGRLRQEVDAFRRQLDALRLCYRADQYFVAVYDFIQRYHGRLNEVWMVTRRCDDEGEEEEQAEV